ncbi:hypothetical protein [Streptomyces sp. NPDC058674]|uniref:hypothetical protein n=1 Tax=Streptomyces sp. NPDC058674 TaxID=3346592 RepID=UPI003647CD51
MAAALLLVGCGGGGGGDGEGKAEVPVAAAEACHGLFRGDGGAALRVASGAEAFAPSTDGESAKDAAGKLAAEPMDDGAWREHRICSVRKGTEAGVADLTVTAERVRPGVADAAQTGPGAARYALARGAWADASKAVVYIDCVSPRLQGADGASPAVVAVRAWNRDFPRGDDAKYREANLALAHAAALPLVEALGCEDNGGVPDRLTVQRTPTTG